MILRMATAYAETEIVAAEMLATAVGRRHTARMPTVVLRDVPDDVYRRLKEMASAADRSLEEYLIAELARITATPTIGDVLDRIESHVSGRFEVEDVVSSLQAERRFP